VIAGLHEVTPAHLAHDAGAFMAEDAGEDALAVEPVERVGVGVADARRHDLDQHLARLRAFQIEFDDLERLLRLEMQRRRGSSSPGDAVLQAWFDRNPARYARDVRYSFDQIYLGADAQSSAAPAILARLGKGKGGKGEAWQRLGQPISLPATLDNADRTEIAKVFGEQFADALGAQKPGGWTGPVASGFGNHLVRIRQAKAASVPRLAEVRQQVENDWRAATMEARKAQAYQTLLDGYTIRIAKP
jgi:hypothetical protein